jgi:hypothetical protein
MSPRASLPPVLVLGSGPIAAVAAIVMARRREVVLSLGTANSRSAPRIDSLPIHMLGLLVELGIHPAQLQLEDRHDTILSTWEDALPKAITAFPKVHVHRQLLDKALLRLTEGISRITLTEHASVDRYECVIDATGRRAMTATSVRRAEPCWVARTRTLRGRYSLAQAALRIAPAPQGYAYRLASRGVLTLGFVSPAPFSRLGEDAFAEGLRRAGGGWILSQLPSFEEMEPGRGGECSVQWTVASGGPRPVGDASFAPDALAAQGLALGLSEAMRLAGDHTTRDDARPRAHVTRLRTVIARCRCRDEAAWRAYDTLLGSWENEPMSTEASRLTLTI